MTELSLHILDIARNSVNAGATEVAICIAEDHAKDLFCIEISDNGCGMDEELIAKLNDPFFTTGNKKTGLGIPLLKQQAEAANGSFLIASEKEKGTTLRACFEHAHIDRQPLGNIVDTLIGLIRSNPEIDWSYLHTVDSETYRFDTLELRTELEDISLNTPAVLRFIKEMLSENLNALSIDKEDTSKA